MYASRERPDGTLIACVLKGVCLIELVAQFRCPGVDAEVVQDLTVDLEVAADGDELESLHRRTGHTSHGILREAMQIQLVTGVKIDRKYCSSRARQ